MDRMDKHLDKMIDIVTHWVAYNSYINNQLQMKQVKQSYLYFLLIFNICFMFLVGEPTSIYNFVCLAVVHP